MTQMPCSLLKMAQSEVEKLDVRLFVDILSLQVLE